MTKVHSVAQGQQPNCELQDKSVLHQIGVSYSKQLYDKALGQWSAHFQPDLETLITDTYMIKSTVQLNITFLKLSNSIILMQSDHFLS
jgi:hypothetical protein